MHEVVYATHPFDVVGWDGYNFPYGFSIHNFAYYRSHQPPPVHQTFETATFVVFVLSKTVWLPPKIYSSTLQS
jgi:homogentisate 1,2-dioxygenase